MGGILARLLLQTYGNYVGKKRFKIAESKLREIVLKYSEYIDNHSEIDNNPELVEYLKKLSNE
jgi:Tfp pilus assembly protein PilE